MLFAGRLSEEKGILEFVEATEGLPRVIVGDGPLRDRVPEAIGFVPPGRARRVLRARAPSSACPSRREGYGMTAREAMAYGRPVVATRVGGLAELAGRGVDARRAAATPQALRAALERTCCSRPDASAPRRGEAAGLDSLAASPAQARRRELRRASTKLHSRS